MDSIIDAALGVIRFRTVRFESLNRPMIISGHFVTTIRINLDWDTEYISMEISFLTVRVGSSRLY